MTWFRLCTNEEQEPSGIIDSTIMQLEYNKAQYGSPVIRGRTIPRKEIIAAVEIVKGTDCMTA